jgi:hypothetical protein
MKLPCIQASDPATLADIQNGNTPDTILKRASAAAKCAHPKNNK